MTAQQIHDALLAHVGTTLFHQWYVGVTSDVERRLREHRVVDTILTRWAQAIDATHARSAESALHKLGFSGGGGGGDATASWVYIYKKTPTTVE